MTTTTDATRTRHPPAGQAVDGPTHEDRPDDGTSQGYGRFLAMIATSALVMFGLKYTNTFEPGHVQFSETRTYMALLMAGAMALVMLGFMRSMYRDRRINAAIVVGSLLLMAGSLFLVRSQSTVQDESWMRSMIPHHSIAILTSERAEISDVRVRELANEIIRAQRREIKEMEWLLDDIERNGIAEDAAEAETRPVPSFEGELDPADG